MNGHQRNLQARWTLLATLHLESASQIGSHESDYGDQTFARDSEGCVALQGSTVGGALRSALADHLRGYREAELLKKEDPDQPLQHLFGNEKLHESPLIFFDCTSREIAPATMRDGVRIDPRTGLADDKGKYDREIAGRGVCFDLRFDLLIDAPGGARKQPPESEMLAHLITVLNVLKEGYVRFGARKSRGLGAARAGAFLARRYDLRSKDGWRNYARSPHRLPELLAEMQQSRKSQDDPHEAILQELETKPELAEALQQSLGEIKKASGYRRLMLDFDLELDSTVIIRSPGVMAGDADVKHLMEGPDPLLSGTSLAGSLRVEAVRVLNTLKPEEDTIGNPERIAQLFGDAPKKGQPYASRLLVSEAVICNSTIYRQTRIKTDRLTGGVLEGALLEEEPAAGGTAKFTVEVLDPDDWQIGLTLLAAREIACGWRPVGGEAAVGRGRLKGSVTITLPDGNLFTMPEDGFPIEEAGALQIYIDALWKEVDVQP